jgi:hypothetical protein
MPTPTRARTASATKTRREPDVRFGLEAATRRRLRFLAGFAVYFAAIWFLWNTPVVYPLKIFVVLLHEVSHAIAAIATGGSIQRIELTLDQGGACFCPGGNAFLTLSAGYLGSVAWGALLLTLATGAAKRHRLALIAVGALLAAMTALYVRTAFGLVFGLAAGFALIAAACSLPGAFQKGILLVLGLTSSLYAILDIKSDIIDRPELQSDAAMLADLTGIPTVVWGIFWIGIACLVSWWLFRRSFARA